MKTFMAGLAIVSLLVLGAVAYAHGPRYGGWGGGHMMDQGYGGHMMDQGYGGHMMDWGYQPTGADKKFLDETADLRKDLHQKRFEYFEASHNSETDTEKLSALEKEIYDLQSKIRDKAPRFSYRGQSGYGSCW